jgi:hypothetical protein
VNASMKKMPEINYEVVLYRFFQAMAFIPAAVFLVFWVLKACIRESCDFKEWLQTPAGGRALQRIHRTRGSMTSHASTTRNLPNLRRNRRPSPQ